MHVSLNVVKRMITWNLNQNVIKQMKRSRRDCKRFENRYDLYSLKTVFYRSFSTTKAFSKQSSTTTQEMHCKYYTCMLLEWENEKSIIIFEKMFRHTDQTHTHRQTECYNPPPTLGLIRKHVLLAAWIHNQMFMHNSQK